MVVSGESPDGGGYIGDAEGYRRLWEGINQQPETADKSASREPSIPTEVVTEEADDETSVLEGQVGSE
jgi:hypothetical protein